MLNVNSVCIPRRGKHVHRIFTSIFDGQEFVESGAFYVPSLMSGTLHLHVYSRLLSVLVCLSLSFFLALSLYIYVITDCSSRCECTFVI